jgi:NTE family protein
MKKREKKLIVVLSGGGAKTAFQVGAWNKILNQGIDLSGTHTKISVPHGVFGVSGGAINGVMMAMGKNKELIKFWNRVAGHPYEVFTSEFLKNENGRSVFDVEALMKYALSDITALQKAGLLFKNSRKRTMEQIQHKLEELNCIANNQPLFDKLLSLVRLEDIKSEIFQSGFVSLTDGQYHSLPHTDYTSNYEFAKAILASSSIPLIWSPVKAIENKNYVATNLIDGGTRNMTPFGEAVNYIQNQKDNFDYHFLVITCHREHLNPLETEPNLFKIAARGIYDIAMDEIRDTDLKEFLRINSLVKQANAKGVDLYNRNGQKLRDFKVKIIRPSRELSFALNFSRSAIMDSFTHGFMQAETVLNSSNWE